MRTKAAKLELLCCCSGVRGRPLNNKQDHSLCIIAKCQGIARELDLHPPSVHRTFRRASKNLVKVEEIIQELKTLGWSDRLSQKEAEAEPEFPMRLGRNLSWTLNQGRLRFSRLLSGFPQNIDVTPLLWEENQRTFLRNGRR